MTAPNQVARELGIGVAVVVVIHLLTALVAITLLGRMAPAIERILQDNVVSIEAVEDMLETLASLPASPDGTAVASKRFHHALERAERNITEPEETSLLRLIRSQSGTALRGDAAARLHVISALGRLSEVNHTAMNRSDDEARRLGTAGAWAVVFLGLAGFLVSLMALRRIRRRVLRPLGEIQRTLAAFRSGDVHRRCAAVGALEETQRMIDDLNDVLDEVQAARPSLEIEPSVGASGGSLREVVAWLLDREARPIVVLGGDGNLVAANRHAFDRLSAGDGAEIRSRLEDLARTSPEASSADFDVIGRVAGASLVALPEAPA